jgi:hypothetical protein
LSQIECYGQSAVKYAAKHATKALRGAADSNRQFKDAESTRNADPTALNDVDFDDDDDDIDDLPAPTVDEAAQFAESRAEARAQHNVDKEKSRRQTSYDDDEGL